MAYPGNNIHLTPHYGVDTVLKCRDLCQAESRCHYWTWDRTNNWCYLKHAKSTANTIVDTRYTSGINNPLCQAEEENEVKQDDEDDDVRQPRKVLDVGQHQGPLLVILGSDGNRTILPAIPATFGQAIQKSSEVSSALNWEKSVSSEQPEVWLRLVLCNFWLVDNIMRLALTQLIFELGHSRHLTILHHDFHLQLMTVIACRSGGHWKT